MRILAIDPSLSSTGVCMDGVCRTIRPKSQGRDRIREIAYNLAPCYGTPRLDPFIDLVVIEECIVGRAVHVESMWLHGVIRHEQASSGLERTGIVDIHPSRRMKFVCGDQKERGKDAVLLRAERAGAKAENNDEADAWWLWKMATVAYGPDEYVINLPQYQREVLAAINWPEVNGYKPQWEMPKKPSKKKVTA